MSALVEAFVAVRDFFDAGGWVLWAIFVASVLMWTLIIERIWFFRGTLRTQIRAAHDRWEARADQASWHARRIRDLEVSRVSLAAHRTLRIIKALMAVLPLLGLLGTVWGMINVFDAMAHAGAGGARAMAGGVYKATLPTMAGLVAALSGLYPTTWLERGAEREVARVDDLLHHH